MPYPCQIVQATDTVLMTYEFASTSRIVRINSPGKSPAPAWMGWSLSRPQLRGSAAMITA